MSEVVALLLDDAMPPERLGALLRSARKRSGMKRKQAAAAGGTTTAKLRAYERGEKPVPAAVCAQLAEAYGDDLTAHVPLRVPPEINGNRVAMGSEHRSVGPDADDLLAGYIDIVRRLRNSGTGDPLALRTVDIVALAGALGSDREFIEAQIAKVLGCSPTEARRLHGELLRRKVILPVAGLAAGMAAFAGVAYAVQAPTPAGTKVETKSIVASAPSTTTPTTTHAPAVTTPTTTAPSPTTTAPVVHHTTPTTEVAQQVDATVPPAQRTADVPDPAVNPPQADPDDPPVSVLPGETPITIIGTPDSTSDTP
jgi:transcriptional regulator with XRE-family HTH domain